MIHVRKVRKAFARIRAVDDVSLEVPAGTVAGLLGSNGAGKTTTVRIIAGSIWPDAGQVSVAGCSAADQPARARRQIGYLPESAPAFPEMPVEAFLDYRARLWSMPRRPRRAAVDRAVERCHLAEVRSRRIGHLSKGYRQRVGLAAALVHDPPALLLDEPTNGLDPTQIRAMRALICELGQTKAVIITSHILSEIEQTCDDVIVMARGRVLARGTPESLARAVASDLLVDVPREDTTKAEQALTDIPGIHRVARSDLDDRWVRLAVHAPDTDPREPVARALLAAGVPARELTRPRPTLESAFLRLVEQDAPEEKGGTA